jgi:hypothetical protein
MSTRSAAGHERAGHRIEFVNITQFGKNDDRILREPEKLTSTPSDIDDIGSVYGSSTSMVRSNMLLDTGAGQEVDAEDAYGDPGIVGLRCVDCLKMGMEHVERQQLRCQVTS